jgi:hypothetical protein
MHIMSHCSRCPPSVFVGNLDFSTTDEELIGFFLAAAKASAGQRGRPSRAWPSGFEAAGWWVGC